MPTITDKLIREAVEEFDNEFVKHYPDGKYRWVRGIEPFMIEDFIETKILQAIEEVKDKLTINNYHRDAKQDTCACSGCAVIDELEELKKTI